jgi:hypothetical protein
MARGFIHPKLALNAYETQSAYLEFTKVLHKRQNSRYAKIVASMGQKRQGM